SRALLILRRGGMGAAHGGKGHKREALPWWIFGLVGGWLTLWIAQNCKMQNANCPLQIGLLDWPLAIFILHFAILFLPGALAGGVLGWFIIRPVNAVLGWVFRVFNWLFEGLTGVYGWTIGTAMRLAVVVLVVYAGLLVLTWWLFQGAPTGFVPQQDMGRCLAGVQLPDSSSLERTKEVMRQVEKIARETDGVDHTIAICGTSFVQQANGPNFGSLFLVLKPFAERQRPELKD